MLGGFLDLMIAGMLDCFSGLYAELYAAFISRSCAVLYAASLGKVDCMLHFRLHCVLVCIACHMFSCMLARIAYCKRDKCHTSCWIK